MSEMETYWPRSLSHLASPQDDGVSEHVVIAEIDESPQEWGTRFRKISTALIPLDKLDEVLQAEGGIGWEVEASGPRPCISAGVTYTPKFWVDGRNGRHEKFESILSAWKRHDQEVALPDNGMLMTYGLVPRYLENGVVCWDDPQSPVYDVIRAQSHVDYNKKLTRPLLRVEMRRNYLEDYCSLRGCAAVAIYFEEGASAGDKSFDEVLGGVEGLDFRLPGRLLEMKTLNGEHYKAAPQLSRVWGVRLLLRPQYRPISDEIEPALIWPGNEEPMTYEKAARNWVYGYISDEVLVHYESRPEFTVYPESGGVSYGGWWGTTYTDRLGRNYIQVELKKLYEGCPPHVIAHWHKFAVSKAVAERDREVHGDRNIAIRAKDLIGAYLRMTEALESLADRLDAGFTQEEIGGLSTEKVEYNGWWSPVIMKPLYCVVSLSASRELFLGRAASLFKLFEGLKPAPLRNLVLQFNVPKEKIREFGAVKLLATLCQLSALALEHGYSLSADSETVAKLWDTEQRLPILQKLFALNALRVCQSHAPSTENDKKIEEAAAVFGIDTASTAAGWGYAIDALYDGLVADLNSIADLLSNA